MNNEKLIEREKRVLDAVALREPDMVPILAPTTNMYAFTRKKKSMAQINYNSELAMTCIKDFLLTYEPDTGIGLGSCFEGHGPMLEKSKCKCYFWAGMPGNKVPDDSIQQFIEFATLKEEEIADFLDDRTWTVLTKILPRAYGVFEPLASIQANSALFPKLGLRVHRLHNFSTRGAGGLCRAGRVGRDVGSLLWSQCCL